MKIPAYVPLFCTSKLLIMRLCTQMRIVIEIIIGAPVSVAVFLSFQAAIPAPAQASIQ